MHRPAQIALVVTLALAGLAYRLLWQAARDFAIPRRLAQ
jgi:hypothetical protein